MTAGMINLFVMGYVYNTKVLRQTVYLKILPVMDRAKYYNISL
jgi:hypothetical protein